MRITRRTLFGSLAATSAMPLHAATLPSLRIGVLRYGTVSWEIDVIRHHALDAAAHIAIEPMELATPQATQVALQAGQVDMIVVDWLWVARQRSAGADWTSVPFSNAVGALIAPANSPVREMPDLANHALGIAGSPLDKSWLILRAYATRRYGIDLDGNANKSFGPPPLLAEQMKAGRLDALLTYWPFAAKAEARGARRILDVEDAVSALGIDEGVPYIGYTFAQHWAEQNPTLIDGFIAASRHARTHSGHIGCRMAARETIDRCRGRCRTGTVARLVSPRHSANWGEPERQAAAQLFDLLARIGGPDLVGPISAVPPGTFWPVTWRTRRLTTRIIGNCRRGSFPRSCSCWPGRSPQAWPTAGCCPP